MEIRSRWVLVAAALGMALLVGAGDRTAAHPRVQITQWNLAAIGAPRAWASGTGRGTTIAIVDTGVDRDQAALGPHIVETTDCVDTAGDAEACRGTGDDTDGHGSTVAGIAAAVADPTTGTAGVAPDAHILGIRVLTDTCGPARCVAAGTALDVVAGIRWATAHGADVINLSIGTADASLQTSPIASAINDAWKAGVIVVAAAGNRQVTRGFATLPVLVVTAVNRDLTLSSYARGVGRARWGLAAPGGEKGDAACRSGGRQLGIVSPSPAHLEGEPTHACEVGTSIAAPQVSGAAAVLRSLGYSPRATVDQLLRTARDLGAPGPDHSYGSGLLALDRAVATHANHAAPAETPSSPATAGTVVARPTRPPLLLSMLAGSLISVAGAEAILVARRIWRERGAATMRQPA